MISPTVSLHWPNHAGKRAGRSRTRIRARRRVLAVTLTLLLAAPPALKPVAAQPPDPPPFELRPEGFAMSQAWARLREESAAAMILEPAKTAAAFHKFLDEGGNLVPAVVVEATTLMAQIYWQELGDKEKAMATYNAGIAATPGYGPAQRLTRELEAIRANRRPLPTAVYLAPQFRS